MRHYPYSYSTFGRSMSCCKVSYQGTCSPPQSEPYPQVYSHKLVRQSRRTSHDGTRKSLIRWTESRYAQESSSLDDVSFHTHTNTNTHTHTVWHPRRESHDSNSRGDEGRRVRPSLAGRGAAALHARLPRRPGEDRWLSKSFASTLCMDGPTNCMTALGSRIKADLC